MASRGLTPLLQLALGLLSLSLALARPARAQTAAGLVATGLATVPGPAGDRAASIRIESRGPDQCRVEMDFGPGDRYLAISNGRRAWISPSPSWRAPFGLVGRRHGCVLLPRELPARLVFQAGGRTLAADYGQAAVTIRDDAGHVLVQVAITSVTAAPDLPDGDFALPAAPPSPASGKGGAR